MTPGGDVAPARDLCSAASAGAVLDVVRPLALDVLRTVVAADTALWTDVDVAGARRVVQVAHPAPPADAVLRRHGHHVALHPAVGVDGRAPTVDVVDVGGGRLCVALPAPIGHRVGVALHRRDPFTAAEVAQLDEVLPVVACAVAAAPRPVGAGALTARETAVLRSVAGGLSDKQAARALGVSPRTVGKHLEHIYAKLGVAGRTEAAVEVGLLRLDA